MTSKHPVGTGRAGTVTMVPVEWIMNNVPYSVDGFGGYDGGLNVARMIASKSEDGSFERLLHTIEERGFRVPIVIDKQYNSGALTLGNGHHRLSAAILLCLDEIPVYWANNDYMSEEKSESENLPETKGNYENIHKLIDIPCEF